MKDNSRSSPSRGTWILNRITHKSFQPYTKGIGEAAIAWNNLQEELGRLFAILVRQEATGDLGISLVIWHSIENDRLQRKLLLKAAQRVQAFRRISQVALKEIEWLKNEADKLSDSRNDAIHSPIWSISYQEDGAPKQIFKVEPRGPWNPRARKLEKRPDILAEIRWCRDMAVVLADYARSLHRP